MAARGRPGVLLRQFDAGMTYGPADPAGRRLAATVDWALAQAVPELPRNQAVAAMDSAQFLRLLDPAGLERAHALATGRRGVARTHDWWQLSDGRAESPAETHARLDCADCGVPADDLQVAILDATGLLLGRGDLGWRKRNGRWLIAEVDGAEVHSALLALYHDRHRQNQFLANGADTVRFTWRDTQVRRHCGGTVARLLAG